MITAARALSHLIQLSVFSPRIQNSLAQLSGEHRIKRIPPTEKKGRKHTSTIVVVVSGAESHYADETDADTSAFDDSDYIADKENTVEEFYKASGAGGQHRNKVETAVRLLHLPTGIEVNNADQRSQGQNRKLAWKTLQETLDDEKQSRIASANNADKRKQFQSLSHPWTWVDYRDEVKRPDGKKSNMSQALKGKMHKVLQG